MTLQIVGSAPGFPHGIIDPIEVCGLLLVSFACLSVFWACPEGGGGEREEK